ncbi:class I SAM-dependent methyltransferase [Desulfococcaceae bacterium HSG9]|nr:class I SAM-dependent methyltransferase [Desulfococcaceae bacterium HSG9]
MVKMVSQSEKNTPCTVCGSRDSSIVLKKYDDSGEENIELCECHYCGTIFQDAFRNDYSPHLYEYYATRKDKEKSDLYNPINEIRCKQLLSSFSKFAPGKTMLDIGCGQGQFVDIALNLGWDISGIDLSESAVDLCQKFGLPVSKLDIFSSTLKPSSFDMCIISEVIEHVSNPVKFINRVEELLKPRGGVYFTTPNFSSLDRKMLGSHWRAINREHLIYFTPQSIRHLIQKYTSLNIEYVRTQNISMPALKYFVQKNFFRRILDQKEVTVNAPDGQIVRKNEQDLRRKIESSYILRTIKLGANKILNLTGLGSSLVVLCKKRM